MSKINIVYWNVPNFGDILSPYIVEELSGKKTQIKNIKHNVKDGIKTIIKSVLYLRPSELKTIEMPWQRTLVGIGSIISWGNKRSIIWGAGFMNQDEPFRGGEVFAVRGPYTDEKLIAFGKKKCHVYGDPALLLPLICPAARSKRARLGIIPHKKETDFFIQHYGQRYKIIDLRTRDVKKVVEDINSCAYILSSSLHGIIVGHAYHIPSLWIKKGYIDTDGFKFDDYFSSVNIPLYKGFENIAHILESEQHWMDLFEKNKQQAVIQTDLRGLQKELLRAAPFPLVQKYRSFIEEE